MLLPVVAFLAYCSATAVVAQEPVIVQLEEEGDASPEQVAENLSEFIMKRSSFFEPSEDDERMYEEDSMGKRSESVEKRSMATGRPSLRPGKRSVAIGRPAFRPGKRSMAIGRSAFRPGKRSIAFGRMGYRPGKRSLSMGRLAFRPGKRSVAMGRMNFRPGKRSIAVGRMNFRPGKRSDHSVDFEYCKAPNITVLCFIFRANRSPFFECSSTVQLSKMKHSLLIYSNIVNGVAYIMD